MSYMGIRLFASTLHVMQSRRNVLLKSGTKQDLRLAQWLEEMKELVAERFTKETLEE